MVHEETWSVESIPAVRSTHAAGMELRREQRHQRTDTCNGENASTLKASTLKAFTLKASTLKAFTLKAFTLKAFTLNASTLYVSSRSSPSAARSAAKPPSGSALMPSTSRR